MTAQKKAEYIIRIPEKFLSVWNSTKPVQIWYGGRGSSKSWTKAIQLLTKAKEPSYRRIVFARDTQKNVRNSQYQLFKDMAARFEAFHNEFEFYDSTMKIVCKANNNFLVGGSFEQPDTLRSVADPTDFWAEEPITRESEIKRQDFYDIAGSLRNSYGVPTQFHFTFNPISKQAWIYKDFFEAQLYDVETLFVNYWDNPYCPDSLKTFLESLKVLDPKRYRVDALGEWGVSYEGLIYDYEPAALMPEPEFYGLDFGFNDPCALVAGATWDTAGQAKKDYYVQELLYESGHTSATLIAALDRLKVSKFKKIICDNARPEMIKDLKRAGYRAEACFKYQGSVKDGINEVKKYNLKIVSGSGNLFDEIANYVWDSKNEQLLDVPADGVDHLMDAMRYALEAKRKTGAKLYSE